MDARKAELGVNPPIDFWSSLPDQETFDKKDKEEYLKAKTGTAEFKVPIDLTNPSGESYEI